MMNPMQPQQMGGMGAAPELSEEELRKLALLLQQMPEGEGWLQSLQWKNNR